MCSAFVLLLLALSCSCVAALDDAAKDLSLGKFENIVVTDASGAAFSDGSRFVRASKEEGNLTYSTTAGYSNAVVSFYTKVSSNDWQLEFFAGNTSVYSLTGAEADSLVQNSPGDSKVVDIDHIVLQLATGDAIDGWRSGLLDVDLLGFGSCITSFTIVLSGTLPESTTYEDVQVSSVQASNPFATGKECAAAIPERGPCPSNVDTCPAVSGKLKSYGDEASAKLLPQSSLFAQANLQVVSDGSKYFRGDRTRYARRNKAFVGNLSYRFESGGVSKVKVSLAFCTDTKEAQEQVYISIRPYLNIFCRPLETRTRMSGKIVPERMVGCWKYADIAFTVGELRGLDCQLPQYIDLAFFAPAGSDVQILGVTLTGIGVGPVGLKREAVEAPVKSEPVISKLYIYVVAGVGIVVILALLALTCWCYLRRTNRNKKHKKPTVTRLHSRLDSSKDASLRHKPHDPRHIYSYAPSSIEVLCPPHDGVLDYTPHEHRHNYAPFHTINDDGYNDLTVDPRASMRGRLPNGARSRHASHDKLAMDLDGCPPEYDLDRATSIDLAMPSNMYGVNSGMQPSGGRPDNYSQRVPRADIFETWQQMDPYNSGADSEDFGPTDSRAQSFTHNPNRSCSLGNSPTHGSSALGITGQIGMRINELKTSMADHVTPQRGDVVKAPPVPLAVVYGKKIGAGGFGAVYEGLWNGKPVAVKVIKMPDIKPGEEKEKMAIMEYAISGLLLHGNIVQTYQADVRPIYLEQDKSTKETAKAHVNDWTGLQEYLSSELPVRTQKLQVHEWEVRLVMEYCNRGNLKEAIRRGSLRNNGRTLALEVALLALDIAKGCEAIHRYKIIHGDLKPHNVLLTVDSEDVRGWIGKIADFGLSVKIEKGAEHVSGIQHGTEGYVAPEVLQTRRMVKASDVYSFGILMWEMWHSKLYYEEYRAAVKRMGRLTLDFRPTFERGCPEDWIGLAKKCWHNNPEERPHFSRVVKMMEMIVESITSHLKNDGTL